ncbi:hypothetical protein ANME2D_02366 [Candidatus Methanoperedens nitroreducens]|uniref:Transcriptional regulators containing the CopG/Arc/MetJ DNA-binding domain n=1 Tax=Candidatus Methanoperedens nitratireducens TaxID=1392998 RepID=A0A062UXB0_9EURY|nr:hypothetical protein ANME2D_02366 [Candidatus Methanoperedens nitroreducens]
MAQDSPTSIRLSPADAADINELVQKGVFTHSSDALRSVIREGIRSIKKERGLA